MWLGLLVLGSCLLGEGGVPFGAPFSVVRLAEPLAGRLAERGALRDGVPGLGVPGHGVPGLGVPGCVVRGRVRALDYGISRG